MSESPGTTSATSANPAKRDDTPTLEYYREQYEAADGFARRVGNFRDEVAIPATNELRYAGHHLLRALNDNGELADVDELRSAIRHCQRAIYEAADAGILSALEMIQIFKNDYRFVPITPIVPTFPHIVADAREAQRMLERTRNHNADGPILDQEYASMFDKLQAHCDMLDDARDEMNKAVGVMTTETRRHIVIVSLTVLGIAVAAAVGVAAL